MTAVTNLPLIIHSLNFNSKPYQEICLRLGLRRSPDDEYPECPGA